MAKKKISQTNKNFPIVGIGGSAGAIEAIMEIVEHLTSHTGMAYVYLQHQSPDFESRMVQMLAKRSKIPVIEVEDKMPVEPDFFYVVPPGKEVTIADGELRLTKRADIHDHLPINLLFTSLADHYNEYTVGIILSGADSDGSQGMKSIKLAGD